MPIAVSEEHEALRQSAQRWLQNHCPPSEPRAAAESTSDDLPPVWEKMVAQGWLGLHVPEDDGGQGFGLNELAVVLEELGYALFPGPVLPTVLVAAVLSRHGSAAQRARYLPGLLDGSAPAAVALGAETLQRTGGAGAGAGGERVSGTLRPVLGLPTAALLLAPLDEGGWCLLDPHDADRSSLPALDATRRLGQAIYSDVAVPVDALLPEVTTADVRNLALVMAAAEGAGVARWCLDTASEYAKVRVQFGRPIGQFQAIKHALADMLVAVEQCAAVAWDAAAAWSGDSPADECALERAGGRSTECRCRCALCQTMRADSRWHRLHLGARRPLLPEAGHGHSPTSRRRSEPRGERGPSRIGWKPAQCLG